MHQFNTVFWKLITKTLLKQNVVTLKYENGIRKYYQ
jgi:hypothetical protein